MLVLLITAATGAWAQTGMTNGLFSVSATKRVYFSKGNLQLVGENTFQFAENQWDYFGSNQSDNHRDLFCWGTGNNPNQTTGNSTFTDWGDNTYLQATLGKGWRTMTKDEFVYVFNTRASGSSVFGIADGRYTTATINTDGTGVNGFILFPDGITIAASEVTTAGTINNKGTVTQCTTAQWAALAEKGCVFLPAGGFFLSGGAYGYGSITDYWSSTAANASNAYNLNFNFSYQQGGVNIAGSLGYNYGCAVRLVIDGYVLKLADGSEDATSWQGKAGEGEYQALPLTGLEAGTAVTVKYTGRLKVKSVTATTDAGTPAAPTGNIVDLSTLTADYEAQNGDVLTGTLNGLSQPYKITIADGATVTLDGATIKGKNDFNYSWAGLNCLGNATIVLKDGTENTVRGFYEDYPGILVPKDKTLTIQSGSEGTGKLTASPFDGGTVESYGAGIGGGLNIPSGDISIEGGVITAKGGMYAAGIGSGDATCGNISITGGTVTATGGELGAGIGGGKSTCGNISITGGTVTATGGHTAAGIGSGYDHTCGNITIASTVKKVTATKGEDAPYSIGKGLDGSCGTVTIGGTVYWQDNAAVDNDADTYLGQATIIYPEP